MNKSSNEMNKSSNEMNKSSNEMNINNNIFSNITKSPLLSAAIMVKDEEKYIEDTILSLNGIVDNIFFLDTGSTDNTIEKIKEVCKNNYIPYFIAQTNFVDFATSKNELLRFVESSSNSSDGGSSNCGRFILLLDSGDILRYNDNTFILSLRTQLLSFELLPNPPELYLLKVKYINDKNFDLNENSFSYFRKAIIRKNKYFYYRYPVHEDLFNPYPYSTSKDIENIYILHDRNKNKSSIDRHTSDIQKLENYLIRNPNDYSIYFKLGQVYYSMKDYENAKRCFHKRTEYSNGYYYEKDEYYLENNFDQETFESYLFILKILLKYKLNEDIIQKYLEEILNYSRYKYAEPFFYGSVYYTQIKNYKIAIELIERAVEISKPNQTERLLIDDNLYDRYRWELYNYLMRMN
jgi:tetratricopeptide (TPR) repeat protein